MGRALLWERAAKLPDLGIFAVSSPPAEEKSRCRNQIRGGLSVGGGGIAVVTAAGGGKYGKCPWFSPLMPGWLLP